jgi:hypothetical protein
VEPGDGTNGPEGIYYIPMDTACTAIIENTAKVVVGKK